LQVLNIRTNKQTNKQASKQTNKYEGFVTGLSNYWTDDACCCSGYYFTTLLSFPLLSFPPYLVASAGGRIRQKGQKLRFGNIVRQLVRCDFVNAAAAQTVEYPILGHRQVPSSLLQDLREEEEEEIGGGGRTQQNTNTNAF
jgi:hypothetical protein